MNVGSLSVYPILGERDEKIENIICDISFYKKEANGEVLITNYDKVSNWEGECNKIITFYNATLYDNTVMYVKARYSSDVVKIELENLEKEQGQEQEKINLLQVEENDDEETQNKTNEHDEHEESKTTDLIEEEKSK